MERAELHDLLTRQEGKKLSEEDADLFLYLNLSQRGREVATKYDPLNNRAFT